jgi:hypothetical protein
VDVGVGVRHEQQYPPSRYWKFPAIIGKSRNSTKQRNINLKKRSSEIYGIQEILENTKKNGKKF